jgi:hypothetical protein
VIFGFRDWHQRNNNQVSNNDRHDLQVSAEICSHCEPDEGEAENGNDPTRSSRSSIAAWTRAAVGQNEF